VYFSLITPLSGRDDKSRLLFLVMFAYVCVSVCQSSVSVGTI